MLARAGNTAIRGVEVHFIGVVEVAQHTHPLKHVYVLAVICNTGKVIQIAGSGFAVSIIG